MDLPNESGGDFCDILYVEIWCQWVYMEIVLLMDPLVGLLSFVNHKFRFSFF